MAKTRILVADDHPLFRQALCRLLRGRSFECIAAADGEEAVRLAGELSPDVVLIDVNMPKMTGIEAARQIKSSYPDTAVLILSAYDYDQYVTTCIEVGLNGYLLKTSPPGELINAIRMVLAGKSVFDARVTSRILPKIAARKGKKEMGFDELHSREVEVLELAAKGMTNKEIANKLKITGHTVAAHLINAFRKLGVQSRTEAVLVAIQNGILDMPILASRTTEHSDQGDTTQDNSQLQ